jgi:hypothetical protein
MRHVRWELQIGSGIEHLVLQGSSDGYRVDSVLVGECDGLHHGLRYNLRLDKKWRTRFLSIDVVAGPTLILNADGAGNWHDAHGNNLPSLQGCIDVDIIATPFTNTLPIRRLAWQAGEQQRISVAWIAVPDLQVLRMTQTYTCITPGKQFRYENVDTGFSANLDVDEDGLVFDYPDMFKRVR